jgi:hypothetical protein
VGASPSKRGYSKSSPVRMFPTSRLLGTYVPKVILIRRSFLFTVNNLRKPEAVPFPNSRYPPISLDAMLVGDVNIAPEPSADRPILVLRRMATLVFVVRKRNQSYLTSAFRHGGQALQQLVVLSEIVQVALKQ